MDEARAEELLTALIGCGLVEERATGDIGPTRRWNARVQAAAERLNADVAKTGTYPEGNPLVIAVAAALREEKTELPEPDFDDCVRLLVTLELSRMDEAKRARYGFSDARFS